MDREENSSKPRMPEIMLYTTEPCRRCLRAKAMLQAHGLTFVEVNLAKDPVGRKQLSARTGHMTFPQVVIDGKPLGGFEELEQADVRGELAALAV
jgi:glutaredoxin 3